MKIVMEQELKGLDDWYLIVKAEHDGREWRERTGPNSSSFMMLRANLRRLRGRR
jgi:hypothetical protein